MHNFHTFPFCYTALFISLVFPLFFFLSFFLSEIVTKGNFYANIIERGKHENVKCMCEYVQQRTLEMNRAKCFLFAFFMHKQLKSQHYFLSVTSANYREPLFSCCDIFNRSFSTLPLTS